MADAEDPPSPCSGRGGGPWGRPGQSTCLAQESRSHPQKKDVPRHCGEPSRSFGEVVENA